MSRIVEIAEDTRVQAALAGFKAKVLEVVELAIAIQQIPAPTFAEARRAKEIKSRFEVLGLVEVHKDQMDNVYGRYPSSSTKKPLPVIISAHMDTVFPLETDLTVKRDGHFVYGPGIGDNSTGLAGLLLLIKTLKEYELNLSSDVWFVANVAEEGLGDLRGMRAVVDHFGRDAVYIILEGGLFGQISHQAISVRRYRIEVEAAGGHSWGSFGNSSAVHILGHIIAAIDKITLPKEPKSTYNVGIVEGGTSVNTIAQSAHLLLDLRSEEEDALEFLVSQVDEIVKKANRKKGVTVYMTQIGNRPSGHIPRDNPLVIWAKEALEYVDCRQIDFVAGSTDANIPLSKGIPAVCVGLLKSGNTHRLDEYIDFSHLPDGLSQVLLLLLAAADIQAR